MNKFTGRMFGLCVFTLSLIHPEQSLAQRQVDLDQLSLGDLEYALNEELDDILIGQNPNNRYYLRDLFNMVMEALSDNGDYDRSEADDDDDEGEDIITGYNLQAEMAEAGVSLEDVVAQALRVADQYSRNSAPEILKAQTGDQLASLAVTKVQVTGALKRVIKAASVPNNPPRRYPPQN